MKSIQRSRKTQEREARCKVFIVDDHPVFRRGLEELVNGEKDLIVCGSAGTVAQALRAIPQTKPDLVLVDISLPDRTGLELIREIRAKDRETKLLVLSMHDEALYANRVLRAGGDGYIMKDEDPSEVVHAIRDILKGHIYVSEQVVSGKQIKNATRHSSLTGLRHESRPLAELTDSELEILELLGYGKTNEEIARKIGLAGKKVEAVLGSMRKKLKLKSYNALIRYAVCWTEGGED
jgi:DNA-binding NarL/FixJ family response regulator